MGGKHISVLRQIVSRRMAGDQGDNLGKLLTFIAGFDDAIERNTNRLAARRFRIGKGALQCSILRIIGLETVQIGARVGFSCKLFQNSLRIDTCARQIVETAQPVGNDAPLARVDSIAQGARRHADFKFGQFLLPLIALVRIEIIGRNRYRIFIRVQAILVGTRKEGCQLFRTVQNLVICRPEEGAIAGIKGNEGLGYRLFGLYVDGFQIAHRRIKSALAWRLIFRLWANGRHAGGQGIDLHRLGCGRHLHVERIKIHLYERLRLIIVNLGALHRHALLNGRKGAYRGLRRGYSFGGIGCRSSGLGLCRLRLRLAALLKEF
ncbi:Uncharacterised protein [Brucella neotomae]|nr:Uncharacterised protein [Brucella neotomae]